MYISFKENSVISCNTSHSMADPDSPLLIASTHNKAATVMRRKAWFPAINISDTVLATTSFVAI